MHTRNGRHVSAVCIGGSAGALEPLQRVVATLPESIDAAVFVTVHTPADAVSALPHILSRSSPLFATHALDGAPFTGGRIYIAPPDCHLIVNEATMSVVKGAKENGYRPSIDVLFRSAAQSHGAAACGVLLSGALDDGVAGLQAIHQAKGYCIAQEPEEAAFSDMPLNAIRMGNVDAVRSADAIATEILAFALRAVQNGAYGARPQPDERRDGRPSVFTCPDCGGTLWEQREGQMHFRCRTGHSYSPETMASLQRDEIERALFSAMRALQERGDMLARISERALERGDARTVSRLQQQIETGKGEQDAINRILDRLLSSSSA
ncbi:MAG: chemotaxis protein CheB [Candidatus Baltobacteraceae bacterium]